MIHVFRYYKALYGMAHFASCGCNLRVMADTKEERFTLVKSHLSDLTVKELNEHARKITPDLMQSWIQNGFNPPPFVDLAPGFCEECDDPKEGQPLHIGSPLCESKGLGSRGPRAHCTCDACY